MLEMNQDISDLISSDYEPISPCEIREVKLPLPFSSTINIYSEDGWMTQEIGSLYNNRHLLKKVYDTFINRDEEQFYRDYCPIRWSIEPADPMWKRFSNLFEALMPVYSPFVPICNYAISEGTPRAYIIKQAKAYKIKPDRSPKTILWARYDFIKYHEAGLGFIRFYRAMQERALKLGLPKYPF